MTAEKKRTRIWLAVIGVALCTIPVAIFGLWVYMSATATPLHPNPKDVASVPGVTPPQPLAASVEQARQIARAFVSDQNLPGLSVAVGTAGTIVWAEGFGWTNLETKIPVSPKTRFRIGSASAALTSAAVGLLVEKDRLKLDEKIQTYVPEFPDKQWPVTLRQVMAHVAGIPSDGGDEGELFSVHCDRPVDALAHFAQGSLRFEPGTQYSYSNYGFILVSAAVEAVADQTFLTFMRRQVFESLGMADTSHDSPNGPGQEQATSYFPRFAGDPRYGPDIMRELDYSCYSGASVFASTPSDLVRFAMGIDGGKLLQPATVRLLQTSQRLASGVETGYGLGWDLESVTLAGKQTTLVGHDGELLGGMAASFMTFPDLGIVVAVTSNTSYADTYALGLKLAEAFAAAKE